jgi:uncharacterized protein YqeY
VGLQEQLTEDMKASMKAGTADRTGVLRLVRGSIKNEEIKIGHPLGDEEVLKVLSREAKQRQDSIEAYRAGGREDLVRQEEMELGVIRGYLPEALSETELGAMVDEVIKETGATDMKQMGTVIGAVMKQAGARADGGAVSKLVREKLAQ